MAIARVQFSEDKAGFAKSLKAANDENGIFQTYADILTVAASVGVFYRKRIPFDKASRRDPDPVLQEQFRDRFIIDLIAFSETQDSAILASTEENDRVRVKIFQEYANGGLEILERQLRNSIDLIPDILLILNKTDQSFSHDNGEFSLDYFLGDAL